jgi:Xaa-Pro aminopeptidase
MESYFSAEFFTGNRANLRRLFTGTAPIVIAANGSLQSNGDATFQFRQDSSFWYLTGVEEADALLVMDKEKDYLIVPKREGVHEAFDGVTDYDMLSRRSGIETIYNTKEGWERLSKRLKKSKHMATLSPAPAYIDHYRMFTNPARQKLIDTVKDINQELTLLDLRQHLTKLRCVKQPAELLAIKRAIAITSSSMKEVARNLKSMSNEYEVEAKLSYGIRKRGAKGHAYDPIVAGGINAATLHHMSNNDRLNPKEMLLIDAGAEVENYAADITRMFAVHELTKRQQTVFEAVKAVHEKAMSILKPGVILHDYEQAIEQYMGEKLRELGLIKVIDQESVRSFYPQLTSHFLGLDVHDVGDYEQPLEPGMVITVEPGIYIHKEKIGIRLEDDVLITTKGTQILSKNLPFLL